MVDLDYKHYKFLVKAKKKQLDYNRLSDEGIKICQYLSSVGCFEEIYIMNQENIGHIQINGYSITEMGKAQILSFRFKYHYWYIPILISLISLFVAIFK